AALAKETLAQDPFCGAVLVFRSRGADRVKILVWDGSGLVLVWKRLEQGAFKWPPITDGVMRLSPAQLAALVEGLDWTRVHGPRIARAPARRADAPAHPAVPASTVRPAFGAARPRPAAARARRTRHCERAQAGSGGEASAATAPEVRAGPTQIAARASATGRGRHRAGDDIMPLLRWGDAR